MEQSDIYSDATIVTTDKELSQAIKQDVDTIEIHGNLAEKTFRIKATGKVAWGIAAGAIATAVVLAIHTPTATVATAPVGGAGGAISFTGSAVSTGVAGAILGPAAITAIAIAVAAGGVGVLTKLRYNYRVVSKEKNKLILKKN